MATKKHVKCLKCGKIDKNDFTNVPKHIGTGKNMVCPDCNQGKLNKYNRPLAEYCRNCCPTGHGTKRGD